MTVLWSGTAEAGSFRAVETQTTVAELRDHLDRLREVGQGYLEVRHPQQPYPVIAVGFTGGCAVVQVLRTADTMAILDGDGSVPSDQVVSVPIMDEDAEFTGEFVSSTDRAWETVSAFVSGSDLERVGEWRDLS